jgi:eukaryotic-like serine/threonine-protein kinase
MIGQTLGHYRIIEKIGEGGMGEVYRARDDRLARDVALKIIHPTSASDQDRLRRFEHEARASAALNHPNIVAIYDIGVHQGAPYIVSELLEGVTLRERLFDGALPVRQATDYGSQIAQGLMAAHEKNIIHRDLKPENVFVTKDGRVKILDFGIAKLIPREDVEKQSRATLTTQTKSGVVVGSTAYMSPEQLRGKPVDHRSDIFSFGAILYEMLSGKRAFRGETDVDTVTAVLKEDPVDITEIRPSVPEAFEPIVAHCLEKAPEDRFQSVRDLAFALTALSSVPTSRTVQAMRAIRAHTRRWLVWASIFVTLAAAAGLWLGYRFWYFKQAPVFRRLTFERGTIYSARFTADGRNAVYDASWNSRPLQLYSTLTDSPLAQVLDVRDAHL